MPPKHPVPLGALLPRIEPLTARQQELSQHSNVKRMLLGVYNAHNRATEIVTDYVEPIVPPDKPPDP